MTIASTLKLGDYVLDIVDETFSPPLGIQLASKGISFIVDGAVTTALATTPAGQVAVMAWEAGQVIMELASYTRVLSRALLFSYLIKSAASLTLLETLLLDRWRKCQEMRDGVVPRIEHEGRVNIDQKITSREH